MYSRQYLESPLELTAKQFGKYAEEHAVNYLCKQGYNILSKNYRYKRAEIDIIAQKGECIYFIEVKARTNLEFGYPESFVMPGQQQLIKQAAENYILLHDWEGGIQFDIIAVAYFKGILELIHFEDAFS